ncbi:MAG: tyrosine-type recombinase/integrase [Christensenellales bacterium]|nr:tyrosine-type recombinase/integrase [Christensenellales bacterium]
MANEYHDQADIRRTKRLRELLRELPEICSDYFIAIEQQTSPLTRLSYAYDLKLFFQYLSDELPKFSGKPIEQFTVEDIQNVTKQDLERYARYLSLYVKNEELEDGQISSREISNHEYGIKRKYASLRAFYKFLFSDGYIDSNTASLVPLPKLHERAIIRLDVDEVARILDVAESGQSLPKTYRKYHRVTAKRDLAMLSLFLGTGIRISECVGLNIDDFDFEQNAFVVTRKGGKEVILYLSDEVAEALKDYLEERRQIEALPGHENAFFLSIQRRRITQRAVENMVKKYAAIAAPLKKKISPHKLRSTFGTNLYRETGDIYLVADVLGHSDVNTTRKHYAAISEDHRRLAAQKTVLRDDAVPHGESFSAQDHQE